MHEFDLYCESLNQLFKDVDASFLIKDMIYHLDKKDSTINDFINQKFEINSNKKSLSLKEQLFVKQTILKIQQAYRLI